jgi:hypothetical protein
LTEDLSGVPAGTYSVTVTDGNGCTASATATVDEPTSGLSALITSTTDVKCYGESTGVVDLTVSGGTSPYTYSWNGGAYTSEDLSGVPAGSYSVTVTDYNGCTTSSGTNVNQPASSWTLEVSDYDACQTAGSDVTWSSRINWSSIIGTVTDVKWYDMSDAAISEPEAFDPNVFTSTPMQYQVEVVTNCTSEKTTISVNIKENPTFIITDNDLTLCNGELGDLTALVDISASNLEGLYYYIDNTYPNADVQLTEAQAKEVETGDYIITAYLGTCMVDSLVYVSASDNFTISGKPYICGGTEIELTFDQADKYTSARWSYSDDEGLSWTTIDGKDGHTKIIEPATNGRWHRIEHGDCTSDEYYAYFVTPVTGLDLIANNNRVSPGETVDLMVTPSFYDKPEYSFRWSENDANNRENNIQMFENKTVSVYVKDIYEACPEVKAEITLEVVWPTAITPYTLDGLNDDFLAGTGIPLTIYNRYGQKVYDGKDGWNGYYHGKIADPGVYFYVATLPNGDQKRGSIEVVKIK